MQGWGVGDGKWEKRQDYSVQKGISVAFQCGYGVCMHGQRDGVVPSPRLPGVKEERSLGKFQIKCLCLHFRKMYKTFGHNRAEA